jgi:hypothetical protein
MAICLSDMGRKSKDDAAKAGKRKPWQFMSKFVIQDEQGDPMLVRWRIIQTPYGGFYLHKFLRGDSDPYVHDHPWSFLSIILKGSYTEVRRNNMTYQNYERTVKRFNRMRRDDAHYILNIHRVPTWSLIFVGRRRRTWGFYVPLGVNEGDVENQRWVEFDNWEKQPT